MAKLKTRNGKLIYTAGGRVASECNDITAVVIEFSGLTNCFNAGCNAEIQGVPFTVPVTLDGSGGYENPGTEVFAFSGFCLSHTHPVFGTQFFGVSLSISSFFSSPTGLQFLAWMNISGGGTIMVFTASHTCSPNPCWDGMQTVSNSIVSCAGSPAPWGHSGIAEVTFI